MITLAFAQMIYYFAISWPAYGGEDGLSITVRNGFPGVNTADPLQLLPGLLRAADAALCAHLAYCATPVSASALQAARQNEVRVAAVGIAAIPHPPRRVRALRR